MKQLIKLFISILSVMTISFAFKGQYVVFAATITDISIYIDDNEVSFPDVKPYIDNNRTMVPLRSIAEQLRATVVWNNITRSINITKRNDIISIDTGYPRIMKNGTYYYMDALVTIINGRAMVPLRFVSEQFGIGVKWVYETNTVLLNTNVNPEDIILTMPDKKIFDMLILEMTKDSPIYIQGILIANKVYPLPKNYNPGEDALARRVFNIMQAGAKQEGLSIYISSGFRSYSYQSKVYNNYVKIYGQSAADTFSARPGYSEHQTGMAFDLNSISDSFANTKEGVWVKNNCYKYGFIIRYPKGKESITGYQYEPWHIRYIGIDMATKVFNSGLCLEEYLEITSPY